MVDEISALASRQREPSSEQGGATDAATPSDILWRVRLLDEFQAATILNLRVSILRRRRSRGLPPTFVRISGQVRYRPADLMTFVSGMKNSPPQGVENA
jgi:hypothetical protein